MEAGEDFVEAGRRELWEETGFQAVDIGPEVGRREFILKLTDGEEVVADERYFLVRAGPFIPSPRGWSVEEAKAIADHRWWSLDEIAASAEQIWPERLPAMIRGALQKAED